MPMAQSWTRRAKHVDLSTWDCAHIKTLRGLDRGGGGGGGAWLLDRSDDDDLSSKFCHHLSFARVMFGEDPNTGDRQRARNYA